jgi:hypothetical protein
MHSGNLCLNLTSKIGWEEFPGFVQSLLCSIGGRIIEKYDAVELRIWKSDFEGVTLSIVWDDYPVMVSIESSSSSGDQEINRIFEILNQ